MPQTAAPRLYVPLALCGLFALGACLDDSLPVTPGTGTDTGQIHFGDDMIEAKDTAKVPVPDTAWCLRPTLDTVRITPIGQIDLMVN